MADLDGKVAIVTGASSGIGLEVACKLVAAGARVALVARRKSMLDDHVKSLGVAAAAFPLDVTDLQALVALPSAVVARFGRLDIIVNNAGLNHRGRFTNYSAKQQADVITTNLTAPLVLTRAALDHLGPGGSIVNVASLAGMVPVPNAAAYSASKAGLRAFTRALADEFPDLHVCTVSPGPVDTEFFGAELDRVPNLVFSQPMSTPTAVADAVLACIQRGTPEIAMPRLSGALATVAYVFPALARGLRPIMEKRGAKAKAKYAERKRARSH
jgi:short-subunit dehydrogenase